MNATEFKDQAHKIACWQCKQTGVLDLEFMPPEHIHYAKAVCTACGAFQRWLAKNKPENTHPKAKRADVQGAWDAQGNHCAHCGLSEEDLAFLGIGKTIQHCPPCASPDGAMFTIGLCAWCQQDSASQMKRLLSLVHRLKGVLHGKEAMAGSTERPEGDGRP